MTVLIINTCEHELHYYEFVKPIEEIVKKCGMEYKRVHYMQLKSSDIDKSSKIIICGTSLRDFEYSKHIDKFKFLKDNKSPFLGICAGMQIMCLVHGCKLIEGQEIGLSKIMIDRILGFRGETEIYNLHNKAVKNDKKLGLTFNICSEGKYVQAILHKSKQQFATLFHPEVRNRSLIESFLSI